MNTKTLMLAGFAALALSAGVANAQNLTPSVGETAVFSGQRSAVPANVNQDANQVPAGSSDVDNTGFGSRGAVHYDYNTLANPG